MDDDLFKHRHRLRQFEEARLAIEERDDGILGPGEELFGEHFYWKPSVYERPPKLVSTEREEKDEEEIARFFMNELGPPVYSVGHWLPRPDAPPLSKRSGESLVKNTKKKTKVVNDVKSFEQKSSSFSDSTSFSSVFLRDPKLSTYVEATAFIEDPRQRIRQCIHLLYGNHGVCTDRSVTRYICEKGLDAIEQEVFSILEDSFFQVIAASQEDLPKASTALPVLETDCDRKVVYLSKVFVPPNASFWSKHRHAFPIGSVDESQAHVLMYVGSAANNDGGCRTRIGLQHCSSDYREKHPKLLYSAMDEPGASYEWRQIGAASDDVNGAIMRIIEAVAIATMHTFTSQKYSEFLSRYGIVESETRAFGANRTGAMKDFILDGSSVSQTAVQLVSHQNVMEIYGGPEWTYSTLPDVVLECLSAKGFREAEILALQKPDAMSLASAIRSKIGACSGEEESYGRQGLAIQDALAGRIISLPQEYIRLLNVKLHFTAEQRKEMITCKEIYVDFPMVEHYFASRWAIDATEDDPGSRLGARVRGEDSRGNGFTFWMKKKGEKAPKEANSIVDWLTNTGMAITEQEIPRRVYKWGKKNGKTTCTTKYT